MYVYRNLNILRGKQPNDPGIQSVAKGEGSVNAVVDREGEIRRIFTDASSYTNFLLSLPHTSSR